MWYASCTASAHNDLHRVVNATQHINGLELPNLDTIYAIRLRKEANSIFMDIKHPGHSLYKLLPSGKQFRTIIFTTSKKRSSFYHAHTTTV